MQIFSPYLHFLDFFLFPCNSGGWSLSCSSTLPFVARITRRDMHKRNFDQGSAHHRWLVASDGSCGSLLPAAEGQRAQFIAWSLTFSADRLPSHLSKDDQFLLIIQLLSIWVWDWNQAGACLRYSTPKRHDWKFGTAGNEYTQGRGKGRFIITIA
jgi:hypothetical protein